MDGGRLRQGPTNPSRTPTHTGVRCTSSSSDPFHYQHRRGEPCCQSDAAASQCSIGRMHSDASHMASEGSPPSPEMTHCCQHTCFYNTIIVASELTITDRISSGILKLTLVQLLASRPCCISSASHRSGCDTTSPSRRHGCLQKARWGLALSTDRFH